MDALAILNDRLVSNSPSDPEFEATAVTMAREYVKAIESIRAAWQTVDEWVAHLNDVFKPPQTHLEFSATISRRWQSSDLGIDALVHDYKIAAWTMLAEKLGIRNLMSVAKREAFDAQLRKGDLPEVDETTITSILLGMVDQARDLLADSIREVFDFLRPGASRHDTLKTNAKPWAVGKKVILSYVVEQGHMGRFRLRYSSKEKYLIAVDNVFHLLDGKGVIRNGKTPLIDAIDNSGIERVGETEYFRFRCFKNGRLHLTFKRLDLVKQLNLVAMGERVIGG